MLVAGSTKTLVHVHLTIHSNQEETIMSPSSASHFGLPQALNSFLLSLWLRARNHGIFSIGVVIGLIVLYAARYLTSPYRKVPPGPRGYPIIGNLFEMGAGQWIKFSKWHELYGQFLALNSLFAHL